jgi:putative peptidoglycan lipid II flippase
VTQSADKKLLIKASALIMLATFLSRIFGLIRIQIINYVYPQELLDAFWAAYKIPNTLRELLAEGALSVAFIPVFAALLAKNRNSADASRLASNVFNALFLITAIVVAVGVLLVPLFMPLYVSGFADDVSRIAFSIELGQMMMPFLLLMSMGAVIMGVLNGREHFAAPAFAPVFFSLGMISVIWFFGERGAEYLAWGVLAGGVCQLIFQLPFLRGNGFRYTFTLSFKDENLRQVLRLMLPAALALGVVQFNQLIVPLFASFSQGGISALQNAILVVQVPQGVFAIAISTALLPGLSKKASLGDMEGFKRSMGDGLALVIFFMVPAALFLLFFRYSVIDAIFNLGGHFDSAAVHATAEALFWYSFGLIAMGGTVLANRFFYSIQNTRTPLILASVSVAVNLALNLLFHSLSNNTALIAFANSISMTLNFVLLLIFAGRKVGGFYWMPVFRESAKIIAAALAMAAAVFALEHLFPLPPDRTTLIAFLRLGLMLMTGILVFFTAALAFRVKEVAFVLTVIRARLMRN